MGLWSQIASWAAQGKSRNCKSAVRLVLVYALALDTTGWLPESLGSEPLGSGGLRGRAICISNGAAFGNLRMSPCLLQLSAPN